MGSKFLANILGWYLIVISSLSLLRRDLIIATMKELVGQRALMLITSMIGLILGLLMVLSHNIWVMGWPIFITFLSWLILLASLFRLFCPEAVQRIWKKIIQKPERLSVLTVITFLLGLFLLYEAYWG